jgi:prepilin-type processing-associated H-X9-DG protein
LLVGEKHVPLGRFGIGWLDSSIYNGNYTPPSCRAAGPDAPLATSPDYYKIDMPAIFGSYHPGVCQFVFCDGSVHALPVSIDRRTLGLLACRNDGQPIPNY